MFRSFKMHTEKETGTIIVRTIGDIKVTVILRAFRKSLSSSGCDIYVPQAVLYPYFSSLYDLELMGLPYLAICDDSILAYAGIFHPENIFYSTFTDGSGTSNIIISDNIFSINTIIPKATIFYNGLMEFLEFGHCLGSHTIIKDVNVLEAGKKLVINSSGSYVRSVLSYSFPHDYTTHHHNFNEFAEGDFLERVIQVFKDYVNLLKGKTVVVPLSAGIDSRFVLSALRVLDVRNVITVTYGLRETEYPIAKKIAEKLGYENMFVEYTVETWKKYTYSYKLVAYLIDASQLFRTPNLQEYILAGEFARMCNEGVVNCNHGVVFVTGDISDVIAGKASPPLSSKLESFMNFSLFKPPYPRRVEKLLCSYISAIIEELRDMSHLNFSKQYDDLLAKVFEIFHHREVPFKYISSVRIPYRLYGFKYVVPLWDARIIEYLLKIPWKLKWNYSFYRRVTRMLFSKLGIDFKDPTKFMRMPISPKPLYIMQHLLNKYLKILSRRVPLLRRNPCGFDKYFPLVLNYINKRVGCFEDKNVKTIVRMYKDREPKNEVAFVTLATANLLTSTISNFT